MQLYATATMPMYLHGSVLLYMTHMHTDDSVTKNDVSKHTHTFAAAYTWVVCARAYLHARMFGIAGVLWHKPKWRLKALGSWSAPCAHLRTMHILSMKVDIGVRVA